MDNLSRSCMFPFLTAFLLERILQLVPKLNSNVGYLISASRRLYKLLLQSGWFFGELNKKNKKLRS